MKIDAQSPDAYIDKVPEHQREALSQLRQVILENLPRGFKEEMSYGMIGYVVPHNLYPAGYHCNPKLPLPFLSIAAQKNFIGFYHMGLYAQPDLLQWFEQEYPKHCKTKLDMGKSCLRLKKPEAIPYELLGDLCTKLTPEQWIALYKEKVIR
jgi:uncharacterized protein YdhG (YjbR/CyaY superfamily)